MFNHTYYHGSIRKYIILFGTLFNQIYIKRENLETGDLTQILRVPITYGPKEKVLQRVLQDPTLSRPFGALLPRLSFEMLDMSYDGDRKKNTVGIIPAPNANKNLADYVYNPVPYNLNFNLYIMVKNAEDGTKILEQILPFFTPEWTTTVEMLEQPQVLLDIPTILNSVTSQDTWDGGFEERRYLVWTLNFTMKGELYGPVKKDKIIKVAKTNLSFDNYTNTNLIDEYSQRTVHATVTVSPGLDANGNPTSDANTSLPYSDISWEDDFGFVIEEEVYPNGKPVE